MQETSNLLSLFFSCWTHELKKSNSGIVYMVTGRCSNISISSDLAGHMKLKIGTKLRYIRACQIGRKHGKNDTLIKNAPDGSQAVLWWPQKNTGGLKLKAEPLVFFFWGHQSTPCGPSGTFLIKVSFIHVLYKFGAAEYISVLWWFGMTHKNTTYGYIWTRSRDHIHYSRIWFL